MISPLKIKLTAVAIGLLFSAGSMWVFGSTVVLPERFKNWNVVVENSPEFKTLIEKNKSLAKQLQGETKARQEFEKQVGKDLRAAADELIALRTQKAAQGHKGFWSVALGVLNIGTQFFLNPFGYIIRTLVSIVAGLVGVLVVYFGVRFLYHRLKK